MQEHRDIVSWAHWLLGFHVFSFFLQMFVTFFFFIHFLIELYVFPHFLFPCSVFLSRTLTPVTVSRLHRYVEFHWEACSLVKGH